jgi:hypothetical protein
MLILGPIIRARQVPRSIFDGSGRRRARIAVKTKQLGYSNGLGRLYAPEIVSIAISFRRRQER